MKLYGSELCPDCIEAFEVLEEAKITYTYIDILESMANLREFLKLRDRREEFIPIKEAGSIGLPTYLLDDGALVFDTKEIIG